MKKKIVIIISAVLGVLVVISVLGTRLAVAANTRGGAPLQRPEMWDGGARGIGYMPHAGIAPFLFFGVIVLLVVAAIVVFLIVKIMVDKRKIQNIPSGNAIMILKERYAKGEINKEEFDAIKKDILN